VRLILSAKTDRKKRIHIHNNIKNTPEKQKLNLIVA
jgi:hypothetical protein